MLCWRAIGLYSPNWNATRGSELHHTGHSPSVLYRLYIYFHHFDPLVTCVSDPQLHFPLILRHRQNGTSFPTGAAILIRPEAPHAISRSEAGSLPTVNFRRCNPSGPCQERQEGRRASSNTKSSHTRPSLLAIAISTSC